MMCYNFNVMIYYNFIGIVFCNLTDMLWYKVIDMKHCNFIDMVWFNFTITMCNNLIAMM